MSIKDRQVKKATDRALKTELDAGRFPNSGTISEQTNQVFYERPAGEPRFLFEPVRANELSNPVAYNEMLDTIKEDLDIAYEESVNQTQQLLLMANAYETEKQLLQLNLRKLKKRMQALQDKVSYPATVQIVQEAFDSFMNIDFKGDEDNQIPRTSSFVDLKNTQTTLQQVYRGAARYDISPSTYTITPGEDESPMKTEETKPFSNALKSTINEAWMYTVTKDVLETTTIQVDVMLPEKLDANLVSLTLHSPKETSVGLQVSGDGQNWKPLKTYTSYDRVEWMFDVSVQYLRFTFSKEEPDHVDGTLMAYSFGAFHLDVRKEMYVPQSFLVSKSHRIQKQIIDSVRLEVEEVIYPQTKIQYFIGMEEEGQGIEWQEMQPGAALHLNQAAREVLDVTESTEGYAEFTEEHFNIRYHSIATLPDVPLTNRTHVYIGDYMWKVETKEVDQLVTEEFLPTLTDWSDIRDVRTEFLPIEDTVEFKEHTLTPNSLQRFTTNVLMEADEEIYNNEFKMGTARVQVYLNNSLIKPIVTEEGGQKLYKYTYRFKAGWNKLEILTYSDEHTYPFKPNIYLKDISVRVLADAQSLREISLYDLYNNTGKKDLAYFAVDGNKLVVNYHPKELDTSNHGVRYYVHYDYLPLDARATNQVRVMAVLSREGSNERVTPILKSYKLLFE